MSYLLSRRLVIAETSEHAYEYSISTANRTACYRTSGGRFRARNTSFNIAITTGLIYPQAILADELSLRNSFWYDVVGATLMITAQAN